MGWQEFMQMERRRLWERREGKLRRALGVALPGESGEGLEDVAQAGDYFYFPAEVPHVAVNRGERPAVFVGARTDPNEQESVVMRPELDQKVP